MWRWSSITNVVSGLLCRRGALQVGWDPNNFMGKDNQDQDQEGAGGEAPAKDKNTFRIDKKFATQVTNAVRSRLFWSYCLLIETLGGLLDNISSWSEGCECHGEICVSTSSYSKRRRLISAELQKAANPHELDAHESTLEVKCLMRGRRSAEYAAGIFEEFLQDLVAQTYSHLPGILSALDQRDADVVSSDWTLATAARLEYTNHSTDTSRFLKNLLPLAENREQWILLTPKMK